MAIEITSIHKPRRMPRIKRAGSSLKHEMRQTHRRARIVQILSVAFIFVAVAGIVSIGYLYSSYATIVDQRLAAGYLTSRGGLYAAPRVLRAGQSMSRERVVEILRRAGYVGAEASDVWSGRFVEDDRGVVIYPRRGTDAAGATEMVRVEFDSEGRIAALTGDGEPLATYALEPEALTNDTSMKTGQRASLAFEDIPPVLAGAILSIEDRRFFEHHGLDLFGIARAAKSWVNVGEDGDRRQGGSTITQQLVKNTYLTPERTLRRKFDEAMLASALERRLSKQDILALYCNEIYLGQRGSVAVRGVENAAQIYFGKALKDLSLAEAATIAGMIQSPARYAPDRHPEKSKARRDTVIGTMLRDQHITPEQAQAAVREPVVASPIDAQNEATAPYFIDYVNRLVESRLENSSEAEGRNLRVYTTIDLELQELAERAVKHQLESLDRVYKGRRQPQAALVALDPRTGHVLAMVGGRRYAASQLNRATDARRQPGSVFKPIVYAAALQAGMSPVSMHHDAPRVFTYDRRSVYRPANYGNAYSMRDVTMRHALVNSLNVVTVDMAMRVGLQRVASLAEGFGLPRPEAYPALALGTTETTPLEIAAAYTAFANGGLYVKPTAIAHASDETQPSYNQQHVALQQQVINPSTAYMITDMLTGVIKQGTARAARGAFKDVAVAGKTGTSRDGWFVGYTPNLVCAVWVGFDDNVPLGLTGAHSALPAWTEFVKGAVELRPELGGEAFARPDSITVVDIDSETGQRASASCPHRERVAVTAALAPGYECTAHNPLYPDFAYTDEADEIAHNEDAALNYGATGHALHSSAPDPATLPASHTRDAMIEIRDDAPRPARIEPLPSARTTRTETHADGRSHLTNEITVVPSIGGGQR